MTALLALILAFGQVGNPMLGGVATWYDNPQGQGHAAAGPALRSGDWRGSVVQVCNLDGDCLVAVLSDACWCGDRNGKDTLLDLAKSDFAKLADPSVGVVAVTVEVLDVVLPATSTVEYWSFPRGGPR